MLVLKCKIEIVCKDKKDESKEQTISFGYVSSVVVKTSCTNLGDVATIVIPRKMMEHIQGKPLSNLFKNNRSSIGEYIKRGNKVTIRLGYEEFGLKEVFKGYITQVEWGLQLTIKCEDKTFLLRQKVAAINYDPFEIIKFLKDNESTIGKIDYIDQSNQVLGNMDIGAHLRVDQALDNVVREYSYIRIFFRNDKLYIARSTEPVSDTVTVFSPERNMIDDSKLTYVDGEDLKLIVTAAAVAHANDVEFEKEKKNNNTEEEQENDKKPEPAYKKITADYPPKIAENNKNGYEQRVFFYQKSISEAKAEHVKPDGKVDEKHVKDKLSAHAKSVYELFKTNRISGSFKAFGEPFVQKGDCVVLKYGDYRPEINGKEFIIDAVEYSFGKEGYRQTITLGYQAIQIDQTIKS